MLQVICGLVWITVLTISFLMRLIFIFMAKACRMVLAIAHKFFRIICILELIVDYL